MTLYLSAEQEARLSDCAEIVKAYPVVGDGRFTFYYAVISNVPWGNEIPGTMPYSLVGPFNSYNMAAEIVHQIAVLFNNLMIKNVVLGQQQGTWTSAGCYIPHESELDAQSDKVAGYCNLCREKEIELYGVVLNSAEERHIFACQQAGCLHPPSYSPQEAEEFDFKNSNDFAEWFLVHSVVEAEKSKTIKVPMNPGGGLKVLLTINGAKVPVKATLQYLEKQHDALIAKEAQSLIQEKMDEHLNPLFELMYDLKSAIQNKLKELGLGEE